jgi:hypothetical protein
MKFTLYIKDLTQKPKGYPQAITLWESAGLKELRQQGG